MAKAKSLGSFIARTSRTPVVQGFTNIKNEFIPDGKIILDNNRLVVDAIEAIKHHNNSTVTLSYKEVRDYISASAISHLLDAWGYLSNSVNSLINGNAGVAIHLGYYAELRAVMSLLASEGIGIFDSNHIGLLADGKFTTSVKNYSKVSSTGTHVFAWEALDKWCKSTVKPNANIIDIFKVKGHNFHELTQGFHPSATPFNVNSISKKWLLKWAFDVGKFKSDRKLRNFVSYRPQAIIESNDAVSFKETINEIYAFFTVLSPSGRDTFQILDRFLLRKLYSELFLKLSLSSSNRIEDLIENAFTNLGDSFDYTLKSQILSINEHPIFIAANKQTTEPFPVIARATLLLRVATGLITNLLIDSGVQKQDLEVVLNKYGFDSGFWHKETAVNDFYKLWVDVEGEFSDMIGQLNSVEDSPYTIRSQFEAELNKLGQFNRAVLWGM